MKDEQPIQPSTRYTKPSKQIARMTICTHTGHRNAKSEAQKARNGSAVLIGTVVLATLLGCQSMPLPPISPEAVGESVPGTGWLRGYLDRKSLPNSLTLLPKPPAEGSGAQAADLIIYSATRAQRGTPRWSLAAEDANLEFPQAPTAFECAMDLPFSQQRTPHLNMLLQRSIGDAVLSTSAAKKTYNRKRPFLITREATCTPGDEASMAKEGSYPSGHAATGWAWALLLTELAPERADALLARGYDFGQSRVICGIHWQSDVDAGRLMGAATYARLQSDAMFRAQLAEARIEIAEARTKGLHSERACKVD